MPKANPNVPNTNEKLADYCRKIAEENYKIRFDNFKKEIIESIKTAAGKSANKNSCSVITEHWVVIHNNNPHELIDDALKDEGFKDIVIQKVGNTDNELIQVKITLKW